MKLLARSLFHILTLILRILLEPKSCGKSTSSSKVWTRKLRFTTASCFHMPDFLFDSTFCSVSKFSFVLLVVHFIVFAFSTTWRVWWTIPRGVFVNFFVWWGKLKPVVLHLISQVRLNSDSLEVEFDLSTNLESHHIAQKFNNKLNITKQVCTTILFLCVLQKVNNYG